MRTRIATDLHDDIGANLTKISILSEVAQQRFKQESTGESVNGTSNILGSVADISRESVSAMGDIVWAINPERDSLLDLTRRMRQHAEEIFERREIDLEFNATAHSRELKLDADTRRNVYLIFKEAVTNVVRHSEARAVVIEFAMHAGGLILRITDNGKGFVTDAEAEGNGLLNMHRRAEDIGGTLSVDSVKGEGTSVALHVILKSSGWMWR